MQNTKKVSDFGKRLCSLAEKTGYKLENSSSRLLFANDINNKLKLSLDIQEISNTIRRHIEKNLDDKNCASSLWIQRYYEYFNKSGVPCSYDYLFGVITCPTHETTDINKSTGLSLSAIQGIQQLNQDDEIATANHQPNLCVMDTLNRLLSSEYINYLLRDIQNYLSPSYIVPIYHTKGKGKNIEKLVCSTSKTDKTTDIITGQKTYIQHFATESDPYDNIPVYINKNFLQTVALNGIKNALDNITSEN